MCRTSAHVTFDILNTPAALFAIIVCIWQWEWQEVAYDFTVKTLCKHNKRVQHHQFSYGKDFQMHFIEVIAACIALLSIVTVKGIHIVPLRHKTNIHLHTSKMYVTISE